MQGLQTVSGAVACDDVEVRLAGRCACGGRLEPRVVHRYAYEDEYGRTVELHNVPARVCHRCGDAIVEPAVLREAAHRIAQQMFVPRHLNLAH